MGRVCVVYVMAVAERDQEGYCDTLHGRGPPVRLLEAATDELVDRTPSVIDQVRRHLPEGFPLTVADRILDGLAQAAAQLQAQKNPNTQGGVG